MYETNLSVIAREAERKEEENEQFRKWLKLRDTGALDGQVHEINDRVTAAIDCTQCGNCCKSLVINVAPDEIAPLAGYLRLSVEETKEQYIEESQQGNCFINTIPCHFLSDNKCTIYEARFAECREFPHLHKPGFSGRLLGTLLHYGRCPIIYNVLEELKVQLNFRY